MLKMFRCVKMHAFFFAEKSVIEKKWIKLPSFVSRSIYTQNLRIHYHKEDGIAQTAKTKKEVIIII